MRLNQTAIKPQKQIFAAAKDFPDAAAFHHASDIRSGLWLERDGVKNVQAANALPENERAQRSPYCFDFRKFRHGREARSISWL